MSPSPFLVCPPDTTPGWSCIVVDPCEIDLRFLQAWLPFFSHATRRHADVGEFLRDGGVWPLTFEDFSLPRLPGEMLFVAVHADSPSAGGFDGFGWNDFWGHCQLVGLMGRLQSWYLW